MFKRFIALNIRYSQLLAKKYPIFFFGNKIAKHDLIYLVKNHISGKKNLNILEIGGIDRPILEKDDNYIYTGLDIEYKDNCENIYDNFFVQSIEEAIPKKYDLIFSSTLLEHVKNNNKSFLNIYKALLIGGKTFHYVPSKNHFY